MNWGDPVWLRLLVAPLVAAVVLASLRLARRRQSTVRWPGIKRVVASGSRVLGVPARSSQRRPWLLLLACSAAIVALARPQWGEIERKSVVRAREVMLAIDLSRSMLAEDVPPNRLERSKLLIRGLLDGLRGERVGLIVFAGTAFVQVPMSADYQILDEFLPELNPAYMPQGGTDYAGMLQSALGGFGTAGDTDRYLVVLSDGEAHEDSWTRLLPELQKREVRVVALGVGTAEGGFIPDGSGGFSKDSRGAVVLSRLESGTLRALARDTNGLYRDAAAWVDLNALLAESVRLGRQGNFTEETTVEHIERFQWPLAGAVLLALLGLWREVSVRPRARSVGAVSSEPRHAQPTRPIRGGRTTAAATLGLALALLQVHLLPAPAAAQEPSAPDGAETPTSPDARIRDVVVRLTHARNPRPEDWRDLAAHTVELGQQLLAAGAPPPRGPILDALAAVEEGRRASPTAADWTALRQQLLRLLETPPEKPPEEQDQDDSQSDDTDEQSDEQEQKKDSGESGGDGKQDEQDKDDSSQDQSEKDDAAKGGSGDESDNERRQDSGEPSEDGSSGNADSSPREQAPQEPSRPASEQGRLGDLEESTPPDAEPSGPDPSQSEPPQPPPQQTRKIGGRPATDGAPPPTDPEMAAALQRLRRATDQDSPARLFQLMEDEKKPTAPGGKDW